MKGKVPSPNCDARAAQLNRQVHRMPAATSGTAGWFVTTLVGVVGLVACTSEPRVSTAPRMSSDRVSLLANQASPACAPKDRVYSQDAPRFVSPMNVWWVSFHESERTIDPHAGIIVVVNDKNEHVCVQSAAESGQCD